ncbi:MAG: hypothetical protein H8E17_03225 [Deltaproteobacteria bacterium]|nr:hypothetical protein [Deltaproteobacteria bacterium]
MNFDNQALIERFIKLGFTEREAKVYVSLLIRKSATAYEIQKYSGVPMSNVYPTIDKLVHKGYLKEMMEGKKRKLELTFPKISFNAHINKLKADIESAETLRDEVDQLYTSYEREVEPFEYVEIIHGRDNRHHAYLKLLKNAKKEILAFVKGPFAVYNDEMLEEQMREEEIFKNRGGSYRQIIEYNENSEPYIPDAIELYQKNREYFRISKNLPLFMLIFDDGSLLLKDDDRSLGETEIRQTLIRQRMMISGYKALFEFFWQQSMEYDEWKASMKI